MIEAGLPDTPLRRRFTRRGVVAPKLDFWIAAGTPNVPPIHVAFRVDPHVVHPVTPAMVGDVNAPDQIAIPYYENIPLKA